MSHPRPNESEIGPQGCRCLPRRGCQFLFVVVLLLAWGATASIPDPASPIQLRSTGPDSRQSTMRILTLEGADLAGFLPLSRGRSTRADADSASRYPGPIDRRPGLITAGSDLTQDIVLNLGKAVAIVVALLVLRSLLGSHGRNWASLREDINRVEQKVDQVLAKLEADEQASDD